MGKAESEVSETGDCGELPLKEAKRSGRLAGNVRHWSCIGTIDRRDPRGVADGTVTIGVEVDEFN